MLYARYSATQLEFRFSSLLKMFLGNTRYPLVTMSLLERTICTESSTFRLSVCATTWKHWVKSVLIILQFVTVEQTTLLFCFNGFFYRNGLFHGHRLFISGNALFQWLNTYIHGHARTHTRTHWSNHVKKHQPYCCQSLYVFIIVRNIYVMWSVNN